MFYCSECSNLYDISKDPTDSTNDGSVEKKKDDIHTTSSDSLSFSDKIKEDISEKKQEHKIHIAKLPNQMYFVCNTCGNSEPIKPRTKIFSKTSTDISKEYHTSKIKPDHLINITTLPRTRNYICPNKQCITHTDLSKREAVMNKFGDTYRVTYICTACKTVWQ